MSNLRTNHPTLHFTPVLFVRVPFQHHAENAVLQPFWRIELIVHIAISVLPVQVLFSRQVKNLRVNCVAQRTQYRNNLSRLRWEKHDISLKILNQAGFKTARQAPTFCEASRSYHCATSLHSQYSYLALSELGRQNLMSNWSRFPWWKG